MEVATIDQVTPPYTPAHFLCRRCTQPIAAGEPAHLVPRLRGDVPEAPAIVTQLIVCSGCLRRAEVGFQEGDGAILPPVRLTAGELDVLRYAARSRMYRSSASGKTRLFLLCDGDAQPCPHDVVVTAMGYKLVRHRLIDWAVVPEAQRCGASGWAVVTDDGARHLIHDNPENEDEDLASTRKATHREIKSFTAAAHAGRCFTSEGGLALERIGRWDNGTAESIRRGPAARGAEEAGYVVRDEHGVYDSTKKGRAHFDLPPTAAHLAAEAAARLAATERTTDDLGAADQLHAAA